MTRQRFEMPVGDAQRNDPRKVGGGLYTEHMHGNDASTVTPAQDETQRYRGLGEAAAQRQAYQADFGKAMGDEAQGWQAHGNQNEAANGLRQAAMGGAPSQAAILGNQAAGQSLQAQMSAGANARGLGQVAAQQQAAQGTGQQQLGAMGQYAGMRGAEMHQAQGAYGQAGGAMRAGDYAQQGMAQQRAEAQAQSEFGQRQLNQGAQMGYEQMGINNQQADADGAMRIAAMNKQANDDATASHDARTQRNQNLAIAGMSAIGSFGGSDERMKESVVPLYEDPASGLERHWDADVAKAPPAPDVTSGASLSGPAPKYSSAPAEKPKAEGLGAVAAKKQKKMSLEEAERLVNQMGAQNAVQKETQLSNGPATQQAAQRDPMGHALETGLKPFEYEYKPGFREQEGQTEGEKNVGPMAQDMASNPITASAVKQAPNGMLMIDMPKATKLNSAGIGYLAAKQRKLEEELAHMKSGRVQKRFDDGYAADWGDEDARENLGPSGYGNKDKPDYNFIHSPSPLNVAAAVETNPGAITPGTEAYMRRQGMWDDKTDALLRDRGLRKGGR